MCNYTHEELLNAAWAVMQHISTLPKPHVKVNKLGVYGS